MEINLANPLDNSHWMASRCCLWLKSINSNRGISYRDLTIHKNHIPLISRGVTGGYPWEIATDRRLSFNAQHYNSGQNAVRGMTAGAVPRTLMLWFRHKAIPAGGVQFVMLGSGTTNSGDRFSVGANSSIMGIEGAGAGVYTNWTADTKWHHFAATSTGDTASGVSLYFDGVQLPNMHFETPGGALFFPTAHIALAQLVALPGVLDYYGELDDVRIYNYALNASQIKHIYNDSMGMQYEAINKTKSLLRGNNKTTKYYSTAQPSLRVPRGIGGETVWWCPSISIDQVGKQVLPDLSGNGNHGTMFKGALSSGLNQTEVNSVWQANTQFGGQYLLNLKLANQESLRTQHSFTLLNNRSKFSISCWVKRNSTSGVGWALERRQNAFTTGTSLVQYNDNKMYAGVSAGIFSTAYFNTNLDLRFVAMTYDGTQATITDRIKVYLDGLLINTSINAPSTTDTTNWPLELNKYWGTSYGNGSYDDYRLFIDKVLTIDEIALLYRKRGYRSDSRIFIPSRQIIYGGGSGL